MPAPRGRKKTKAEKKAEWDRIKAAELAKGRGVLVTMKIGGAIKGRNRAEKAMAERVFVEKTHADWMKETGRTTSCFGLGRVVEFVGE